MNRIVVLKNYLTVCAAVCALSTGCVQVFITAPEDASVTTSADREQALGSTTPAAPLTPSSEGTQPGLGLEPEAETAQQPGEASSGDALWQAAADGNEPEESAAFEGAPTDQWLAQGDAFTEEDRVVITPDEASQLGAAWHSQPVDFSEDVELTFAVYSGDNAVNEYEGGDGMVFALTSTLPTQPGEGGGGMGYGNLSPESLGLELDTYPDPDGSEEDHLALNLRGQIAGEGGGPIPLGEIEDGQTHLLRVVWGSNAQTFDVYYGEGTAPVLTYQGDLVSEVFGGQSTLYYGFTGSTGGAMNLQYVQPLQAVN